MEKEFIQLSSKVIKSAEGERYFSKAMSAAAFRNIFFDEEAQHEVSVRDTEIQLMNKVETYASAVIVTFTKEEDESCSYVDVIFSDVLGTFISDWY